MRTKAIAVLFLALLLLIACGKKGEKKGVELNLEISPGVITDFLFINMNYTYDLTDKFTGLDKDYTIFVHFWRTQNREMLLGDDHKPPRSTREWKKGDKITYSRKLFIPKFLEEIDIDFEGYEEIKLTVGLYDPVSKDEAEKIILYQKVIKVETASLNAPEIVYSEGWNSVETDLKIDDPHWRKWRWTTKKAVCIIENPKKASTLIIRGGVDKNKIQDQKIAFKINNQVLDEFIPGSAKFEKQYTVTPEQMGAEYEFKFEIETNQVFVPAELDPNSTDKRELGVQIYFFYFRESL
jgi:hypothetical protein